MTTDITTSMPEARPRLLRRSRSDRFAAGVCGGLGEYFGVDPILFRVVFAVAALFGGSGVLAYLLAWAVIPEAGTQRAPVDGWVRSLREHRVPLWVVALALGALLWATAFSWWAPGPFIPVVAVVVLLVVALNRRDWQGTGRAPAVTTVSLQKDAPPAPTAGTAPLGAVRSWVDDARRAARIRRRRALPVKIAALGGMAVVLIILAAIDALSGVPMVAYFWTMLGFAVVGLLAGAVLRRTPWSLATLLPLSLVGVLALGGSHAAFHDGVGQRTWTPTTLASSYRLGVGHATLDLRQLSNPGGARTSVVTVGAGQVTVIVPAHSEIFVDSNVHIGQVSVRDATGRDHVGNGGVGVNQTTRPVAGAAGNQYVIDVHLADGQVVVERR